MPGTLRSALSRSWSSSSSIGELKLWSWIARNTRHSLPGSLIRAATTARHAREVALRRDFGAGANGIPYRRRNSAWPERAADRACTRAARTAMRPR